jgi:hypothetical protein
MNRELYNRIGDLFEAIDDDHLGSLESIVDCLIELANSNNIETVDKCAQAALQSLEEYTDRKLKSAKDSIFHGTNFRLRESRIRARGGE